MLENSDKDNRHGGGDCSILKVTHQRCRQYYSMSEACEAEDLALTQRQRDDFLSPRFWVVASEMFWGFLYIETWTVLDREIIVTGHH